MDWIYFAVFAYLVVSFTNLVDKLLVDKYITDASIIILFSGTTAFVTGIIIYFFRGFPIFSVRETLFIFTAGVLLAWYLIPYFLALRLDEASRVVPLFQAIPVLSLLLSYVFLHESITYKQGIGTIFIIVSAFLLSVSKKRRMFAVRKTFWYMMLSSALFALALVLFKFVVSINNVWDSIAYENIGIGIGTLLVSLLPGYSKRFFYSIKNMKFFGWVALGFSEIFLVIYRFALALALASGPVGIISILGGLQPLFVFVISTGITIFLPRVLKESLEPGLLRFKLLACAFIFVGLYFLYV